MTKAEKAARPLASGVFTSGVFVQRAFGGFHKSLHGRYVSAYAFGKPHSALPIRA
jgi:hypothetical protein